MDVAGIWQVHRALFGKAKERANFGDKGTEGRTVSKLTVKGQGARIQTVGELL
jgi:hypothetical protein